MSAPVLSVGILVADIFVPPIARLPEAGELVSTEDFLVQPGGCAANTAIVLGRLGVPATVVGRVGDDLFGESRPAPAPLTATSVSDLLFHALAVSAWKQG